MTKFLNYLTVCLFLAFAPSLKAEVDKVTNAPDSVYLFSYADAEGHSGLKFAWSADANRWFAVADGYNYVKCDFGPWGRQKKMFRPQLMQSPADGKWHCLWTATPSGEVLAHAASPDLLKWGPQSYFAPADRSKYAPAPAFPITEKQALINGKEENGWMQRVPYALVEQLTCFAEHKKFRQMQNDECTAQDAVRFAGLKPVQATIQVQTAQTKPISEHLVGIFFEDINYAADGGLYAELVQNRDFEYTPADRGGDKNWHSLTAWGLVPPSPRTDKIDAMSRIDTISPIHPNNPNYLELIVRTAGAGVYNTGFDGIALKQGAQYDLSLFARYPQEGRYPESFDPYQQPKSTRMLVRVVDKDGKVCAESPLKLSSRNWKKYHTTLTATADIEGGRLQLIADQAPATIHLDKVSLFPRNTFKNRKNGLRADLAQTLADLKPRFVRFPGGCVAHGDGIDNIYDWKGSIGPLEARKPLRNLWGYHQTRGLGYHEYFLFCEDIGATPVPVVAAGVPCQNSGTCSHHSNGELGCNGQQGGIPMEDMPAYIQDVLDLIEYANGDARKTVWGKKRAEAGHPAPFNLQYIGIGNEDLITDIFAERFTLIFNAVKEKYPEITVIGTTGPFYEGTDYDEGWALASKLNVPMVDEHYYVSPGWLIHNQDFYDRYDRTKPKVYLGEYAAHLPGRPNNIETALAEALYLTAVERNADVVTMTSYAPLLAKEGHTQWNPDLIYFNNTEVKPTVGYYTQQMYGQNAGNEYVSSAVTLDNTQDAVKKRIGVSVVRDAATGDYIVKLVNLLPVEVTAQVQLEGVSSVNPTATKTLLAGDPKDQSAKPVTSAFELEGSDFPYTMPAYSFTVIRIHD